MTAVEVEGKASFTLRSHNPDVLTCIANLSNDEVFTPPSFAAQMLDSVAKAWAADNEGADIWADPTVTFLDPFTKSGVFLREITTRLTDGLAAQFPDLQERVDHILTKQVYGIGITQLTALLARRSVYCSKDATGEHSIATSFDRDWGNIWFERTEHTWAGTKCAYCGAQADRFDRGGELETHAYAFIHATDIKARLVHMFGDDVQFDVIVGNPPYQMTGGAGGSSDSSIYQLFVEQAQRLEPRYLSMVIPSRWLAGGRGLDDFRANMLTSGCIRSLVDYPVASEAFPGVEVKGGICYFLWDASHAGSAHVTTVRGADATMVDRDLGEFDVFVRDARAADVLRKVRERTTGPTMDAIVSNREPFKLESNFRGFSRTARPGDVALFRIEPGQRRVDYVARDLLTKNTRLIDRWKLLVPKAYGAGETVPHQILGRPEIAPPPSVCTGSYLVIEGDSEAAIRSIDSYYRTKFFRFMVSLRKITQDAFSPMYSWVPQQSWDRAWTDADLYAMYELDPGEIEFIESRIKNFPQSGTTDAEK